MASGPTATLRGRSAATAQAKGICVFGRRYQGQDYAYTESIESGASPPGKREKPVANPWNAGSFNPGSEPKIRLSTHFFMLSRTGALGSNGTENSRKAFSFLNTQSIFLLWR